MKKDFDFTVVDNILAKYPAEELSTIAILQDVQEYYHYLPEEVFPRIAKAINVGEARLYGVATFYENFSLDPKGKYVIRCCDGTACHVRGSLPILNKLREELGLSEEKKTTDDLMFTVDTTGSMGDEIYYLQEELQDVIKRVQNDTANIPVRLSVNFYRDLNDEYVVRPYEFSTSINEQLAYLNKEYATGGGDFEEAVETALANSVNDHAWDENSIKLMFLVLDAPPHNTEENRQILMDTITKASEMGIRIIPVASSGIDKDTEFLLRAFAMATGGTYTFLTDDSGVGGSHLEPTVGEYQVEQLNDLLVRLIEQYIG